MFSVSSFPLSIYLSSRLNDSPALPPLFERHCKGTAFSGHAGYIQASLMLFDDLPRDGQPQTDSPKEIVPTPVKMIEATKDARHIVLWDSDAMILHRNDDLIIFPVHAHFHIPAPGTELDGIVDQRHERTLKGL